MDSADDGNEFVRRSHQWLADNAPAFETPRQTLSTFAAMTPQEQADEVGLARRWEAHKAAAGWAGVGVPCEYGGLGRSRLDDVLFTEAESHYRLPSDVFAVTKGMIIPTLLAWGTEQQRRDHLRPILDGSHLWCQLYSEPGAGSDLAALATRATRTADGWRINGQKVWTSFGHRADMGYLLARTDPDVPKHKGISAFLLAMDTPGVTARPLRQATGSETFAEVFFDDVELPTDALIGPENGGWQVAITTLMNERLSLNSGVVPFDELVELARARGAIGEPAVREGLVRLAGMGRVIDQLKDEQLGALQEGRDPGPEGSTAKVVAARAVALAADLATEILGPDSLVEGPWPEFRLGVAGMKLGGGTEEILKNIIAERVLGLPADVRSDRDVPWRDLPRS